MNLGSSRRQKSKQWAGGREFERGFGPIKFDRYCACRRVIAEGFGAVCMLCNVQWVAGAEGVAKEIWRPREKGPHAVQRWQLVPWLEVQVNAVTGTALVIMGKKEFKMMRGLEPSTTHEVRGCFQPLAECPHVRGHGRSCWVLRELARHGAHARTETVVDGAKGRRHAVFCCAAVVLWAGSARGLGKSQIRVNATEYLYDFLKNK